jgi:hypothetical protein
VPSIHCTWWKKRARRVKFLKSRAQRARPGSVRSDHRDPRRRPRERQRATSLDELEVLNRRKHPNTQFRAPVLLSRSPQPCSLPIHLSPFQSTLLNSSAPTHPPSRCRQCGSPIRKVRLHTTTSLEPLLTHAEIGVAFCSGGRCAGRIPRRATRY